MLLKFAFFKMFVFTGPGHNTIGLLIRMVILLTSPDDNAVVKQKKKQHLHEIGHILNAFEFDKAWTVQRF